MALRVQQWGSIWQQRDTALQPLIEKGFEHAQELNPQTEDMSGPAGFDFFRASPLQAMKDLIQVLNQNEAMASIPSQWTTSLVAEIERPIALVASLYWLWCRLRSPYTRQWQLEIQQDDIWERAVPGTACMNLGAVMRDLAVDCKAGRLRRIITMKTKCAKASRKIKKLQVLKIPMEAVKLKLYKGRRSSRYQLGS